MWPHRLPARELAGVEGRGDEARPGRSQSVPLPSGGDRRRLGPMAAANRKHDSTGSGLGGLLIGDALSVGLPGRSALLVAGRHGDPPTSPCGSGDNHPDGNKPSADSAGAESPSGIEGRSRRNGDHGVPLSGGSLNDLDVIHDDRCTRLGHRDARTPTVAPGSNARMSRHTEIVQHLSERHEGVAPTGTRCEVAITVP